MQIHFTISILAGLALTGCGGHGITGLTGAVRDGDVKTVLLLLRQGADPNAREGVNDWAPLMHAVHKRQNAAAIALIKGGADVDARMANGETALMMAAGYGYAEVVRALLDGGADPTLRTYGGETALTFAVLGSSDIDEFTVGKCQTETVRALLDRAPNLKLNDRFPDRAARWMTNHGGCREVIAMVK